MVLEYAWASRLSARITLMFTGGLDLMIDVLLTSTGGLSHPKSRGGGTRAGCSQPSYGPIADAVFSLPLSWDGEGGGAAFPPHLRCSRCERTSSVLPALPLPPAPLPSRRYQVPPTRMMTDLPSVFAAMMINKSIEAVLRRLDAKRKFA